MSTDFDKAALDYHRYPKPGKLEISATKNMLNQRDLALAYSPGVAAACREIEADPAQAGELTARSNLVGVIANGTAVLGVGNIGALASKPVMEGKAVLFKKFADIDVFDLELNVTDVDEFVNAVAPLEPTFGGINLEDIKAPECFEIERQLRARMNIPVFHDDQHNTAIVVCAAVRNGLRIAEKQLDTVRLVCSGAGAAALACLNLLVFMGLKRENITVCDIDGVVFVGRTHNMDDYKGAFAQDTQARRLEEVIDDADIFLGLSAPNVITGEQVARMAKRPFILALANPDPEIHPDEVRRVRDDAIMATGRSDFPNQVNNVLCFPFLFRGALDVGATVINQEMQVACVDALANIALREASDVVAAAYGGKPFRFGVDYLIPKPFDPRLITEIPPAVARAAMASGVATRPIKDCDLYAEKLSQTVFKSGLVMKPVFERVNTDLQRVVLAEGTNDRVLNTTQILVDDHLCHPILISNREAIESRISELGLRLQVGTGFDVIDPRANPDIERHVTEYSSIMGRRGVSPSFARSVVQSQHTVLAALLVRCADDVVGQPMLAHKAVHEGKVAAEVCAGHKRVFDAHVIPSVAYTDPEVAWAGLTENEAKAQGISVGKGVLTWAASGRSMSIGRSEGITKLLFDEGTHRVLGAGIVGPHAGDLIAEVALAIEMGADATDLGHTIHPHPTLSETVNFAAEMYEGTITDLIAPKKKH